MRVLNADTLPKAKTLEVEKASCHEFKVRGRGFLLDSNSLALLTEGLATPLSGGYGVLWKPVFALPKVRRPRMLVFQTFKGCNFACKYCMLSQIDPSEVHESLMTFEVARTAINHFFPNKEALQSISIGFFGGEPLLNWKLMQDVTLYVEGLCKGAEVTRRPHFNVTTNAALITPEIAVFLTAHRYGVIVSLDGPQDVHDANRVTMNGKGTYEEVIKGLELLRDCGLSRHVTLRSTFTPDTSSHLVRMAEHLNELVRQGLGGGVSIEPAFLSEAKCLDPSAARRSVSEVDFAALEERYLEVADWYVREVKEGRRPIFFNISKFIERLLWTIPSATECGACVGYFSVDAQGRIYPCHRLTSGVVGQLFRGGLDEEKCASWLDNRLYQREGCPSCSIRFLCGGGCREESLNEHGYVHLPFEPSCALKRIFLRSAAWIMSELSEEELRKVVPCPSRFLQAKKDSTREGSSERVHIQST